MRLRVFDLIEEWVREQGWDYYSCSFMGHHSCQVDPKIVDLDRRYVYRHYWLVSHFPFVAIPVGDRCFKIYIADGPEGSFCVFAYESLSGGDHLVGGVDLGCDWLVSDPGDLGDPGFFDCLEQIIDLALMGIFVSTESFKNSEVAVMYRMETVL